LSPANSLITAEAIMIKVEINYFVLPWTNETRMQQTFQQEHE
jgi:hypothetical protein